MLHKPIYDPKLSYEENYQDGPFGAFRSRKKNPVPSKPQHRYLGFKVGLPFGIPAGPLLNSNFVSAAFKLGFDVCVYKTVRSDFFPCHPHPNILPLAIKGDLTLAKTKQPLVTAKKYDSPLSITNSFGVPSQKPDVWQADVQQAVAAEGLGQVLVLSFMGTVKPNQTRAEFIDDYVLTSKLAAETKAKVLEANLSCPNIGNEGLVCYNLETTAKLCQKIRRAIGNRPFVIKVGYYPKNTDLLRLAEIAHEYTDGVAGINTLQTAVVNTDGQQALPGQNRLRSGICGSAIKWAGLDFVRRLAKIRHQHHFSFHIEGVGGVTQAADYQEYRDTGADSVMSATGAMWNPFLAQEIKTERAE